MHSSYSTHSRAHLHLLTLLHERRQRAAEMLHHQLLRAAARQPMRGLHAQLVQHEWRDDRVDGAHAELMQVLGAEALAHAQ